MTAPDLHLQTGRGPAAPSAPSPCCPNCGEAAPGRFCSTCGQRQAPRLASLRSMAAAALADQFSLEAALPRTLGALLVPGRLTREYLDGRIARYIQPLRLYLLSSLVFFFALSWTVDAAPARTLDDPGAAAGAEPLRFRLDAEALDRDARGLPAAQFWILGPFREQVARLRGMSVGEFERRFAAGLTQHAPKAVFVLIPVFALCLKLLYLRQKHFYAEHFVFALHVHAFAFLLFTLMLAIPGNVDVLVLMGLFAVYLLLALRRVYRQSLAKTVLKYAFLTAGYGTAFLLVLAGTAMVTAFTL